MSAAELILQLLDLGQQMRDDIRPADDSEGLAKRWDDLLSRVAGMELNEEWRFLRRYVKRPADGMQDRIKTSLEIVSQANALARELHRIQGYVVPDGYRFDKSTHPRAQAAWAGARKAMLEFTATDPDDAVQELEEEDE